MFLRSAALAIPMLCVVLPAAALEAGCLQPGPVSDIGGVIASTAIREHREFGGHVIHQDGSLWKFGSVESESELLYDPETGLQSDSRSGHFAWRRVWDYWLALDRHAEGEAMGRKVIAVPGLLDDPNTSERPRETELRSLFRSLDKLEPNASTALSQAAVRAALNDSAWSAAFIAYLMDAAGLSNAQFRYSPAHSFYIKRAFDAPPDYAFRACDPRKTIPRKGDLLCYSRARKELKSFRDWEAAVRAPNFAVASHCDAVVDIDIAANKIDTVGGNVLQSVTRRTLNLNASHHLSDSYRPDRVVARAGRVNSNCVHDRLCNRENFNVQYWSVLLQVK